MKKIIISIAIILFVGALGLNSYIKRGTYLVDSKDGHIEIIAQNAWKGSGEGSSIIIIKEGERLFVKSDMEKGAINIKLFKKESYKMDNGDTSKLIDEQPYELMKMIINKNRNVVFNEKFTDKGTYKFDLPSGEYVGLCICDENLTTGKIIVTVEAK
ncbi:MAG: hypothetical protein J6Y29_06180 [Clostridiales bacterium]|nr:hypothetical protein [Clostridiales bacterium]